MCVYVPFSPQSPPPAPLSPQPGVQSPAPPPQPGAEGEGPAQRTVEVAIPHVGTFVIESEEGGYDDEVVPAAPPSTTALVLFGVIPVFNQSQPSLPLTMDLIGSASIPRAW